MAQKKARRNKHLQSFSPQINKNKYCLTTCPPEPVAHEMMAMCCGSRSPEVSCVPHISAHRDEGSHWFMFTLYLQHKEYCFMVKVLYVFEEGREGERKEKGTF